MSGGSQSPLQPRATDFDMRGNARVYSPADRPQRQGGLALVVFIVPGSVC